METASTISRVAPSMATAFSARVSRDDVRNALHTHFHTQAAKQQQLRGAMPVGGGGGSAATSTGAGAAAGGGGSSRKRVYSFILVQKKKVFLASKRLFGGGGSGGGGSGSVAKSYILCVTVQDAAGIGGGGSSVQLHYVQLLSTFAVEIRQCWDISKLHGIENNGVSNDKKRGSFGLFFQDEDTPWQWLVDDNETSWAMDEFVWSLCALSIDQKKQPTSTSSNSTSSSMPRLVRFNLEELNEVAIHHNLPKRYGIDVDLLDHMAAMKKKAMSSSGENQDDFQQENGQETTTINADGTTSKNKSSSSQLQQQRLTAAENEDAAALLKGVNWNDTQLHTVEEELKKQLRSLEDENITFLLSFEGDNENNNAQNKKPNGGAASQGRGTTAATSNKLPTTSVDKIIVAIDALQKRVDLTTSWSNESSEQLENTSQNMMHFESLNNQLEVHFKNSVALQETLAQMMAKIEIPRENMSVLIKPLPIFPEETTNGGGGGNSRMTYHSERGVSQAESEAPLPPSQRDLSERVQLTFATIKRVDQAIKSTQVFPASEMAAFRTRGDELAKLAKTFCDKLGIAFDGFLQRKVKNWAAVSRLAAAATAGASGSPPKSRPSMLPSGFGGGSRDNREASSSVRGGGGGPGDSYAASRVSRTITSFSSEAETKEMDWNFTNELFHAALLEYQVLFELLQSLDPRALANMRSLYCKHTSSVYGPHMQTLFRCLRDKLPKSSSSSKHGPHFSKPQALQSWSNHLSTSFLGDAIQLGAAPLLQQAFDHIVPILRREQHFLSMLFFPSSNGSTKDEDSDGNGTGVSNNVSDDHDNDELTVMMEGVFDKTLRRLIEFGEAAAARNILDALSLVVLVNPLLPQYQQQSAFLYNIMVSFQLQMKRLLIKFTEDQETWIQAHTHTDTRMAGVLSPIHKTLVMVGRLEECVCGKNDDATLATIYNRMLPATMQWLDKISESKPKYTSLTRLENYLFLHEKLLSINASLELPLAQYAVQAKVKYHENLQLYLTYVWNYEFKLLAPLFDKIILLLKSVPVQEIAFHTPRQDVRRVLEAVTTSFDKSVKSMHDRMKKHFSVNNKMLPLVWGQLVEFAKDRMAQYETIAADCYQLRLDPTPQRAVEMLNKFASAVPSASAITASAVAKSSTNSSAEY